ncbi:hypothetical protein [Burkholderia territorii]|uniref:hypothetical protein n=1 Tax=Burkholderia territorii TaxID=1503055 RepID=UPI0018C8B4B9|nr:hypothetical protein [Burkholderia territorii]
MTQRAGQREGKPGAARVPSNHPTIGFRRAAQNVSDLIYACRPAPRAGCAPVALCKGSKKFSRDFPESMSPVRRRAFGIPPDRPKTRNVSSEKHHLRRYGFLRPEKPLFSRIAVESPFRDSARGLRLTIFSPTMHSPDSAIERDSIRINDNTKRLRQIRQPSPQTGHHVHSQSWSTLSRQTLCSMADG